MKLFISPHNDDETLFGAFTIMRERPTVAIVYDSYVQPSRGIPGCDAARRRKESLDALSELSEVEVRFGGIHDTALHEDKVRAFLSEYSPEEVWIPAEELAGHDQHNLVGAIASDLFRNVPKIHRYLTYTRDRGKSAWGIEVQPQSGEDIQRKLRALACYTSQLEMHPGLGCWPHFMRDLNEYVLPPG